MTNRAGRAGGAGRARGATASLGALVAVASMPGIALAHGDEVHSINTPQAFSPWDLAVLGGLMVVGTLYALGAVKLARRGAAGRRFEPVAFGIGWSALVLSILPPIDSLSIQYFSVHMIQHELMMLVGAPLLILGRPLQRCLAGLSDPLRAPVVRILQRPAMSGIWAGLPTPLVAWALHGVAI